MRWLENNLNCPISQSAPSSQHLWGGVKSDDLMFQEWKKKRLDALVWIEPIHRVALHPKSTYHHPFIPHQHKSKKLNHKFWYKRRIPSLQLQEQDEQIKKMKSIRTSPGRDGRCLDPATSERRWERGRAMPDPAAPEHWWEAKRIERTRCCAGSDRFRAPAGGRWPAYATATVTSWHGEGRGGKVQGEEEEERWGGGFRERGESDNEGGGRDKKFKDGFSSSLHPF